MKEVAASFLASKVVDFDYLLAKHRDQVRHELVLLVVFYHFDTLQGGILNPGVKI